MVNEVMLKEWYDDMLDDCYPEVEVMGLKYSPSIAFYRLDPIAYQTGMNDYESTLRADHEEWGYHAELFADEKEEE
tara:strand:- start:12625 stop:12852 length:228 start_codon:yes stop_codon:yes gene_type:complete